MPERQHREGAAIERGSGVEGPPQRVHQSGRLAPRPGATTASSALVETLPGNAAGEPAHGLGERPLGELGKELHARRIRSSLEGLEHWLQRGIGVGVAGQRNPDRQRATRGRRGTGQRGEEPHHAGRKRRSHGQLDLLQHEVGWPTPGEHAARGNPARGHQLHAGAVHVGRGRVDQTGEVTEPGTGGAESRRCLLQGRGGDAAVRELLQHPLQGRRKVGLRAWEPNGPGPTLLHRGREKPVKGGAAAGPEPRRRDDGVTQPLERPAIVISQPLHGGRATLRPADDTEPGRKRLSHGRARGVPRAQKSAAPSNEIQSRWTPSKAREGARVKVRVKVPDTFDCLRLVKSDGAPARRCPAAAEDARHLPVEGAGRRCQTPSGRRRSKVPDTFNRHLQSVSPGGTRLRC